MAYKIVDKKVIHISPPNNLTKAQSKAIDEAKVPKQMLELLKKIKLETLDNNGQRIRISY